MSFNSTDIKAAGDGELKVQGDLTIRGVTRNVTFAVEGPTAPAKDPWGNPRIAISAITKINRKDFGLTWNAALETGGILVGDEVTITLELMSRWRLETALGRASRRACRTAVAA